MIDTALPEGRRGRILAVVLTLTVLAALWFGVAQPLIDWHAEQAEELESRGALATRMAALVETLPALRQEAGAARPAPVALLEGGTDAIAGAAMQGAVQALARTAGASLASIETLPAEPRGAWRRIGLRVSLTASWPVLVELMRAIEQGSPGMLIDELQMRGPPVQARSPGAPVQASFTILAFRAVGAGETTGSGELAMPK
jgi:general secretion pathway protein M